jgi:nitrite reductase/ring-hydroxylating ferredoxin subunit
MRRDESGHPTTSTSTSTTTTTSGADRRTFCAQACQLAALAPLAALAQACDGGSPTGPSGSAPPLPTINTSAAGGTIALTIGTSSPLANVGGAALVRASGSEILVARTGASSVTAVTAVCTHEACTITGFEGQRYVCPCHGSRYTTDGAVVNGPATRSLRQFPASLTGDTVTITL